MQFHSGEIEVQTQAGVRESAERLCSSIGNEIKPAAQAFLQTQQLAIASSIDLNSKIWASLLTGSPGFVRILNARTVEIDRTLTFDHLLEQNLQNNPQIGLLVIDLANRRRLRINGQAEIQSSKKLNIQIQQIFFNCPKYIQVRHLETVETSLVYPTQVQLFTGLTEVQQNWIAQADTFFIASAHPETGADASHRGGYPGFVQVLSPHQLIFPDYAGNNMFQTLGNLVVNPHAGLLFVDFEQGKTLQLTGTAQIIWDEERCATMAGAQRLVEFSIEQILETTDATLWRWRFVEYSPANPGDQGAPIATTETTETSTVKNFA